MRSRWRRCKWLGQGTLNRGGIRIGSKTGCVLRCAVIVIGFGEQEKALAIQGDPNEKPSSFRVFCCGVQSITDTSNAPLMRMDALISHSKICGNANIALVPLKYRKLMIADGVRAEMLQRP